MSTRQETIPNSLVSVYLTPNEFHEKDLRGFVAVPIDVLRATTSMITALANGARCIKPCLTRRDAQEVFQLDSQSILGGERGGVRIEGFHVGNSPAAFSPPVVRGRCVIMTTTNGTRAIHACRKADDVFPAAFVNMRSVCDQIIGHPKIALVCAGTDGMASDEDTMLAGAIAKRIVDQTTGGDLSNQARLAMDLWRQARTRIDGGESLFNILAETKGAENLLRLGYDDDIRFAAKVDKYDLLAKLNLEAMSIVPVS